MDTRDKERWSLTQCTLQLLRNVYIGYMYSFLLKLIKKAEQEANGNMNIAAVFHLFSKPNTESLLYLCLTFFYFFIRGFGYS